MAMIPADYAIIRQFDS